jgi:hypothetical protein
LHMRITALRSDHVSSNPEDLEVYNVSHNIRLHATLPSVSTTLAE